MKTDGVLLQLDEAREHLDGLIQELRTGKIAEDDDVDLQIQVEHILDHLCFAWSGRHLSVSDYGDVSQEEFERFCHTIPDLFGVRTATP